MKVAILCQEEPIFLGPFLRQVISINPAGIAAVFIAGRRGAGERKGSLRERLQALRVFWLIMEPRDFFAMLWLRFRARLLGTLDPHSIEGLARKLGIPVQKIGDPNGLEFHQALRQTAPDIVLNQSECLLKRETLAIPRLGFVNRHASLLPQYRGRMACFWSHCAEKPRYGLTIHLIDAGVDTGPIIIQHEFKDVNPTWPYPKVMRRVCADAPGLFWKAMSILENNEFVPASQAPTGKPCKFPSLDEARLYCKVLADRRRKVQTDT